LRGDASQMKRFLTRSRKLIERCFPERQIYHRAGGRVRSVVITTGMQLSAIGGACALTAWLAAATLGLIVDGWADERLRKRLHNEVREARAAEAAAVARTDAFDREAGAFRMRHDILRELLDLADDLSAGEDRQSPGLDGGRILMAASNADLDPRQALLDPADEKALGGAAEERIADFLVDQEAVLSEVEDSVEHRLENLRAVLRLTGVRVDEAIAEGPLNTEEGGAGGPLINLDQALRFSHAQNPDNPFSARVARIASRLIASEQLDRLINAAPLGVPVDGPFWETSPYGPRIDPFTHRLAMHAGKDFSAYRNASIVAPASGRVIYASWRAGYGRTIEVDHGYGFRTRYGHLHSIDVRRGDEVEFGQRLGGMGSTGRSTGTHLHYEIWFRDAHINPENLIRAGRYVH